MKTHSLTALPFYILSLLFYAGLGCYAQGNGITVHLITEPGRILKDEYGADIRVVLSNGTDKAVQVLDHVGIARTYQLFMMLDNEVVMHRGAHDKMLSLPRQDAWSAISENLWGYNLALAPGQVYTWGCTDEFRDSVVFESLLYWINQNCFSLNTNQVDMCAQVLVGHNQWVYSNTNTLRFSQQKIKDGILCFTGTYTGKDGKTRDIRVYEHTTDGERFLFCGNSLSRICKIAKEVVPSFEMEADAKILKVTFSDKSPTVRFDVGKGRTLRLNKE